MVEEKPVEKPPYKLEIDLKGKQSLLQSLQIQEDIDLVKRKIPNLIIDQTLKNGYLALSLDSNNSKFEHMKNDLQMRFELTLKKIEIDLY